MKPQDIMTMQQAEQKMICLREVFQVVRLLDGEMIQELSKESVEEELHPCMCYTFWNKHKQCKNCISQVAFHTKEQTSKIEMVGSDLYQVFARYVEIDGKPYIMEMIQKLKEDTLMDGEVCGKLITKITNYREELYQDALTGAYNRRFFEDKVREMSGNIGVAVIDVDDFKLCNDTYGHNAGDLALETVAKLIGESIRHTDILIRYGGDEFLLILPDVTPKDFEMKLRKICKKIYEAAIPGYSKLRVTVSIGGAMFKQGKIDDAISRADRMMYQAKIHKNKVVMEWEGNNQSGDLFMGKIGEAKQKIMIVDDSEINRKTLKNILQKKYDIIEVRDGKECLSFLKQNSEQISSILLNIMEPEIDGFEVLITMNREHWIDDIPVIVISNEDKESQIQRAYELGASDYISVPFNENVVYRRIFNLIKLYAKQRRLIQLITDQIYEKEKNSRMLICVLSQIVEFRDGESGLHVLHINLITEILLEQLMRKTDKYHISWEEQQMIITASAMHDIGKIGIDEKIFKKPGKLTLEEFEIMKTHTIIGVQILKKLDIYQNEKLIRIACEICRWHHERYDGKGYPDGLKGEQIPISAQIVALADAYDALINKRFYKESYSHEQAIKMILDGECGAFNPILIDCLVEAQGRIKEEIKVKNTKEYVQKVEKKSGRNRINISRNKKYVLKLKK